MLMMSASFGSPASHGVVFAKKMKNGCLAEAGSFIRFFLFIDQQREFDAGVFAELTGVDGVAEADGNELSAFLGEFLLVLAQLRNMLAAENSAIVAKKDYDGRFSSP